MEDYEDQIFEEELVRQEAADYHRDFNAYVHDRGPDEIQKGIEIANRTNRPYVIRISPRFEESFKTPYQSTNAQCINQNSGNSQGTVVGRTLVANIMQQIGGINVGSNVDVSLPGLVNPKSKRLLSIRLETLEPLLRPNISGKVSIPLYQCLTEDQLNCILYQYGLKNGTEDRDFVCVNHGKGFRMTKSSTYKSAAEEIGKTVRENPMEGLVAEVAGRMLGGAGQSRNWDLEQTYMQNIQYTIRVGSKKHNALEGTEDIHAGDTMDEDIFGGDPTETARVEEPNLSKYQKEKDTEDTGDWADDQWKGINNSQHAVHVEHTMVLTTHKVLSPRLRSCFDEIKRLTGLSLETRSDVRRACKDHTIKNQLVILLTILFKEHENNIRVWRDSRGEKERIRQKTFAAYSLMQYVKSNRI